MVVKSIKKITVVKSLIISKVVNKASYLFVHLPGNLMKQITATKSSINSNGRSQYYVVTLLKEG